MCNKISFLIVFVCLITNVSFATIWTVSNDANRPAQFTTVQAAVNEAVSGDTVLIIGSGPQYNETVNILKPLVFVGEDMESPRAEINEIRLERLNSSMGSSGSKFYGLAIRRFYIYGGFTGSSAEQRIIEDIEVERCLLYDVTFQSVSGGAIRKNIAFRNNRFWGSNSNDWTWITVGATYDYEDIVFTNNIFSSQYRFRGSSSVNLNGELKIRNNLFLNATSGAFQNIDGAVVENNIFYKAEPTGATNSAFNNNLTYLCNDNALPYGTNTGGGNIVNQNPLFANYPALGGVNHTYAHDYELQVGSPAIGNGTTGTNIGISGGVAPVVDNLKSHPRIPVVTNLHLPVTSVPVGGTLQINIQGNTRD